MFIEIKISSAIYFMLLSSKLVQIVFINLYVWLVLVLYQMSIRLFNPKIKTFPFLIEVKQ